MKVITVGALAFTLTWALILSACGPQPSKAPDDGDAVRERALAAQTARRRTGAEIQERAENRIIRTVYICQNSERLTVDFDNPRQMATVRDSGGMAYDLFREQAEDGLWYKASGHELRGRQGTATWTTDGQPATECRAVD
jgi:hypothetical protein